MTFLWPTSLFVLGAIPILIAVYLWLRRRRHFAVRYSSLALLRDAIPRRAAWRRHIPLAAFLLALASLVVALARPTTVVSAPADQATIILAIDVSRSMCSTDIQPSRIQSAETAALGFIRRQKATTHIGVVAFSSFAELIESPTTDPERLQSAIQSLVLGSTTAIGSGILKSLDAIAEADPNVSPSQPVQAVDPADGQALEPTPAQTPGQAPGLPMQPDIIILLTDGVNNTGPQPLDGARQSAERGVRVYTIGYGTANGSLYPDCPPQLLSSEPNVGRFGILRSAGEVQHGIGGQFRDQEFSFQLEEGGVGRTGGSGGFPRGIDEDTLKKVAAMTGGTYSSAESASQLQEVFDDLPAARLTHQAVNELSVWFTALGAALAALAVGLSLLWRPV